MPGTTLLNVLNTVLYAEFYIFIYFFLGLCTLLIIASFTYGLYLKHDDIRYFHFVHFIVFSLNFFTNGIILTSRIFEQEFIILGTGSLIILFVNKFIFDISTTIRSQQFWSKPAFMSKRVEEWYKNNEITFTVLSFFLGSIGAVTFVNSRLFVADIFFMGIPDSMIVRFVGNSFWEVFLIQRLPELFIQFVYVILHGSDNYVLYAFITTILSFLLLLNMKHISKTVNINHEYMIHHTAFLIELSSEEIMNNPQKYLLRPNALKEQIAEILEVNKKLIEIASLEAIKIASDCDFDKNKKVNKCYGIKAYITVNTITMSRRFILMQLKTAKQDGTLMNKMVNAWELEKDLKIEDVVMVYSLYGDLVIPRVRPDPTRYIMYFLNAKMGSKAKDIVNKTNATEQGKPMTMTLNPLHQHA